MTKLRCQPPSTANNRIEKMDIRTGDPDLGVIGVPAEAHHVVALRQVGWDPHLVRPHEARVGERL